MAASPRKLKFLLISDIHFGPSAVSPDFALKDSPPQHLISGAIPMKANLIKRVRGEDVSAIFASGDLTSKGRPSEFKQCSETVYEIGDALGVEHEDVFLTFGNHDVDWEISSLATGEGIEDTLYRDLAGSSCNVFVTNPTMCNIGPLPGCAVYERDKFVLFVANTGFHCSHDHKYSHGFVGEDQFNWLTKSLVERASDDLRWWILLMHHHPQRYPYPTHTEDISCLQEGTELLALLGKCTLDMVCHGHRHHPFLRTMIMNGWAAPVTFLCAGSLAVRADERRLGEIPNVFHVVSLESRGDSGAAIGNVRTYQYRTSEGWTLATYSLQIPFDGDQKFGCVATENERRERIHDLVASLITSGTSPTIDLPSHQDLPLPLQCMPMHKLNALIKEVINQDFSLKIIGSYPDQIAILR